jgi:acetyl esterase/lipase
MFKRFTLFAVLLGALAFTAPSALVAQQPAQDAAAWATYLANEYSVVPNVTYLTASNTEVKLDVYTPAAASAPLPTVLYFHGGGYRTTAIKEARALNLMPYMQMGWNAINVEYRPSGVALAPAAVEDARCALRWVIQNAKQYNVDVNRIVLTGQSAGAHLALIAGMLPATTDLDRMCPGPETLKVAAIVNWYGIFDHTTLVDDPTKTYAISWIGPQANYKEVAARVSPITYMRAGLPPTITIHGDADTTVPFEQPQRMHAALTKLGVANELVVVPGGRHGNFARDQYLRAYGAIREFLTKHGVVTAPAASTTTRR